VLTERQRDAIAYYRAYSAPAQWCVEPADAQGRVAVTATTPRGTWTYLLDPDGTCRALPAGDGSLVAG
jgi:hypothetical protein